MKRRMPADIRGHSCHSQVSPARALSAALGAGLIKHVAPECE